MATNVAPPLSIPQPRAPIPSMMIRFFAFIADVVVLYFLGYTLNTMAREPLMKLGHALPLLGSVAAFAYFWLADSPLGGGTTLGKAVLNIHVVRPDGEPLSYGASFRRTLLKFPWVIPAFFEYVAKSANVPVAAEYYVGMLLHIMCVIIFFTLGYMVVMDTFRRGWHDIWAKSYVTSSPTPDEFTRRVNSPTVHESIRGETTRKMSLVLILLVGLLLIGEWAIGFFKRDVQFDLAAKQALVDAAPIRGYAPKSIDVPAPGDEERFLRAVDRRRRETPANEEVPTTDTLRRGLIFGRRFDGRFNDRFDGRTAAIYMESVTHDLTKEQADSPEMLADLEALRAAWPAIQSKAGPGVSPSPPKGKTNDGKTVRAAPSTLPAPVQIDTLLVTLTSSFDFFPQPLLSPYELRARIPVNDAAAPIELQWIDIEAEQKRLKDEADAENLRLKAEAAGKQGTTSAPATQVAPSAGAPPQGAPAQAAPATATPESAAAAPAPAEAPGGGAAPPPAAP